MSSQKQNDLGIVHMRKNLVEGHNNQDLQNKNFMDEEFQYEPSIFSKKSKDSSVKNEIINIRQNPEEGQISMSPKFKSVYQSQSQIDIDFQKNKSEQQIIFVGQQQELKDTWKHGALVIIDHITKFIKQLKTHSSKQKYKLLNASILKFIDDRSSDVQEVLFYQDPIKNRHKNTCTQFFSLIYEYFIEKIPVFEPDSIFKIFWDIIVVLLIVINVFYIPIRISFKTDHRPVYLIFELLPSYIFIIDILINFNTAYYSKGVIHRRKKQIIKNYIFGNFLFDMIIVVIPFVLSQFSVPFTQYTLLLRVTRIRPMVENLEEILNFSEYVQAILELIKSAYFIILVSHMCACAWHFIGEMEYRSQNYNWLVAQGIEEQSWETKYIYSFYFSIITTVTVGYGDIGPVNNVERIFVVIITLFICGVFGYTISSIGEIFKSLQEKEQLFRQKMKSINSYLKQKQLSQYLQLQVKKYFEYYYQLQLDEEDQGEVMMKQLTKKLKENVAIDLYYNILSQSKILKNNLSKQTIEQLCVLVKEKKYAPEELIVNKGEIANKLIYIALGEISIDTNSQQQQQIRQYHHGQFVGEREFFINQAYDYSIKTERFTIIYYINYEDFRNVLNQVEVEKICLIKDQLCFSQNQKNFGQICEICQWTHQFIKQFLPPQFYLLRCPFVFFQANINQIIMQHLRWEKQIRKPFCERNLDTYKTWLFLTDTREAALNFIIEEDYVPESNIQEDYLKDLGFIFKFNQPEEQSQQSNVKSFGEKNDSVLENDIEKKKLKHNNDMNMESSQGKKELNSEISMGTYRNLESLKKIDSNLTPRTPRKKISRSKKREKSTFLEVMQRNLEKEKQKSKIFIQSPSINSKKSQNQIEEEKIQKLEKKESQPPVAVDSNDAVILDQKYEAQVYYPEYNYLVIITKVNQHYEQLRLKELQSKRSIFTNRLSRLKSLTHRSAKNQTKPKN